MKTKSFIDVPDQTDLLHQTFPQGHTGSAPVPLPEGTFCGGDDIPLPPGTFHVCARRDTPVDEPEDVNPPLRA